MKSGLKPDSAPFSEQGYSLNLGFDHAFRVLGFESLVFSNANGNARSRRIKKKTGARLIGLRPMRFVDPEFTEAETWEITVLEYLGSANK